MGTMKVRKANGNYQGVVWKITNSNGHSILVVEHETGLEILFAIGAIASVVELIWKVASVWNRGRFHHFPDSDFNGFEMERRRFGEDNKLTEEPISSLEIVMFTHLFESYKKLDTRISKMEEFISSAFESKGSFKGR